MTIPSGSSGDTRTALVTGWFPRLMVVTVAIQFVLFAVRPFISYQALALGATATELGVVTASFSVLSLVAALPLGRAVDRRGERPFVVVGVLVLAVVPLLLMTTRNIATLAVMSAAVGLGHLCAMVGVQTLIAKGTIAERRDRRFGTFTLLNSVGQLIAPAAAGLIAGDAVGGMSRSVSHGDRVYVMTAVVGAIGVLGALSLLVCPGTLARRAPTVTTTVSRAPFAEALRAPSVPVALVASFTSLSAIDLLAAYLPAYAQSVGISVMTVGFLLAVHGLASVLARLVMQRLLASIPRRRLLTVSLLTPALGLAAFPFVRSLPVLFVIMVVTGLGLGLCQPITMAWLAGQVPREIRGTAMSVRLAGNRLGQTVVPLGVGGIAGIAGLSAAFIAPAALLALGSVMVHSARQAGEN